MVTEVVKEEVRGIVTEVVKEEVTKAIDVNNEVLMKKVHGAIEDNNHVLKREIRDEIHSVVNGAVAASERRMIDRMDAMEDRLMNRMDKNFEAITDLIDDGILPEIKEHRREIDSIKRQLATA
jgi:hypothetical protein